MRIGVISDTHDRHEAVAAAVRLLTEQKVELLLHCGDIESLETVALFRPIPTHFVFGNWDGDWVGRGPRDTARLRQAIADGGGRFHEPFGHIGRGARMCAEPGRRGMSR